LNYVLFGWFGKEVAPLFWFFFWRARGQKEVQGEGEGTRAVLLWGVPVTWSPKEPKITDFMFGKQ